VYEVTRATERYDGKLTVEKLGLTIVGLVLPHGAGKSMTMTDDNCDAACAVAA
jgi:hypothetical protein